MSTTNQLFLLDPLEYSGSIFINEPNENLCRNQFIYSGNSYGTNYAIYAKFNCENIKDDDSHIKVTIELNLINYKGVINIGFVESSESTAEYLKDDNLIEIKTSVQGLASQKKSEIKKALVIPRKEFIMLTLERELIPLSGEKVGINSTVNDCFSGEVFDDNFYYREGNFYSIRKDFDSLGMMDSLTNSNSKTNNKSFIESEPKSETVAMLAPGHRCRVGKSQVYVF